MDGNAVPNRGGAPSKETHDQPAHHSILALSHLATPQEVAGVLRCTKRFVQAEIAAGRLDASKVAGRYLVTPNAVAAYIERQKVCPSKTEAPGLIYREDRGVWEIIWFEHGRRRRKSTGTGDRREADKALGEWLLGQEPVCPRDPAQRRVAEVLAGYAEERGTEAIDGARIGYAIKALLPFWGACVVGDFREQTCRAYAKSRGRSQGTIRRELSTLRSAINYDYSQGRTIILRGG